MGIRQLESEDLDLCTRYNDFIITGLEPCGESLSLISRQNLAGSSFLIVKSKLNPISTKVSYYKPMTN